MPEPDTREIVERLLQGKARLLAFLEGRLGHRADAEDVLQQALLVLVEKRQSLRRGESIVAWFHTVLRNLVVDALRRRQARAKLAARLTAEVPAATSHDPALLAEVCACVHDVMTTLRHGYAEILKLVDLDNEPVARAAKQLGITAGNASVRLYRARRALLEGLRRMCGACLEHGCLDCTCRRARGACSSPRPGFTCSGPMASWPPAPSFEPTWSPGRPGTPRAAEDRRRALRLRSPRAVPRPGPDDSPGRP